MPRNTVRACTPDDIQQLADLDSVSGSDMAWEADDFEICLNAHNCDGMVAVEGKRIIGYLMYMRKESRILVLGINVLAAFRRRGVASKLLSRLANIAKRVKKTTCICFMASERMLDIQMLLKSNAFSATKIKHDHFGPDHDGYFFVRQLRAADRFSRALNGGAA